MRQTQKVNNKINICHLSDLHFGIYENKSFPAVDDSFSLTDSLIEFICTNFSEDEKPHFLLISGDVTSISDNSEYEEFLEFVDSFIGEKCFAKCNFGKYSERDRTIVVPGNHDTVRKLKEKGKFGSDKLESFRKNIAEKGFNTPFDNSKNYCFEINSVESERVKKSCPIPCALYYYPEYNIVFHALVSCYFSHKFNPEVLELYSTLLKGKKLRNVDLQKFKKDVEEIIYNDFGHFPKLYMRKVRKTFRDFKATKGISEDDYKNIIKFAVTHHQVIPLESNHRYTEGASEMRTVLFKNGVISILHGHLHEILEERYLPKVWEGQSSFFSCGTVAAYCRNALNKFNMIEIQNYEEIKKMMIKITCYEVNAQGRFTKERARELYSSSIKTFLKSMNDVL